MGNKISRRRDTAGKGAEPAATEQTSAGDAAASQLESEVTQTQEAAEAGGVDAGEPLALVACSPPEECASERKEAENPAATLAVQNDEQQSVAEASPAPVQPELFSGSEQPTTYEPAAEAHLAPEPNPEPVPVRHPGPAPAEALEQQTDMLTQEFLPKPVISSPPLIDLGVPDLTPEHVDTDPNPTPVTAGEPSDVPVTEEYLDGAEAAEICTFETDEPEEAPEFQEESTDAAASLDELVREVEEDSISGLLKNLELQGNDLVNDVIPSDVKFTDDTPITDISLSTELM